MSCEWREEVAQRFADETLDAKTEAEFAGHLPGCETCRQRVAEARWLEELLRAGIRPVAAPATLASRIVGRVTAEREQRRAGRPRLFGRWSLSPVLAGLALMLGLGLGSYAVAPEAVTALARRLLLFIPGLGTEGVNRDALVSTGPVAVQLGEATLTVEALLSDGQQTTIKYEVTGLPGGKSGWEREGRPRTPSLRDASGQEYEPYGAYASTGGSPEESVVSGKMHFAPLPRHLRSVQLVVPMDYIVPPAVLLGSDSRAWVVDIPLVPAEESSLPAAKPQSAETTLRGVTLRVPASTQEARHTVLLVEGEAEGEARLSGLGRSGGDPAQAATLSDERGRSYELLPQGSSVTALREVFRQDLYFQPVAANAGQLTLRVPALQVREEATAEVTIPLAGREIGETIALERTIDLGGYPVRLQSARLDFASSAYAENDQPWLYVQVDLGPTRDGVTLTSFEARRPGGSAAMHSFGSRGGEQLDQFGVPVDAGAEEVTIQLSGPILTLEGPWEITFPVAGQ